MKTKKYDITKLDGLKKAFDDSVKELAEEMVWRIQHTYETVIEMFYNDYDPLWYHRTYSTYEASSGADSLYSPTNIYQSGNQWSAGIHIDPSYISGKPYRADTEWVFNRTFVKGIHGINAGQYFGRDRSKTFQRVIGKERKKWSAYLNKMVPDRRYEVKLQPRKINGKWVAGKNVTIKKYYETATIQNRTMSNMSPSPKGVMSKEFRLLTRKKNMKQLFNDILTQKIH